MDYEREISDFSVKCVDYGELYHVYYKGKMVGYYERLRVHPGCHLHIDLFGHEVHRYFEYLRHAENWLYLYALEEINQIEE